MLGFLLRGGTEIKRRRGREFLPWTGLNVTGSAVFKSHLVCVRGCVMDTERNERRDQELSGALFNDKTSFCWNIH